MGFGSTALAIPPVSVDVSGATLNFNNEDVKFSSLYYPNIFESGSDCVSAYVNWTEVSNVGELYVDGDAASTLGLYVVGDQLGPEDENGREPALSDVKVDFRIVFGLNTGCNTDDSDDDDVILTGVCLYVKDIDDRQFVSFQGSPSYQVLDGPLTVDDTGGVVTVSETQGIESDDDQQEHWAQFSYDSVSSPVDFSVGIATDGDGYAGFEIDFQCAPFGDSGSKFPWIDPDHFWQRVDEAAGELPDTL